MAPAIPGTAQEDPMRAWMPGAAAIALAACAGSSVAPTPVPVATVVLAPPPPETPALDASVAAAAPEAAAPEAAAPGASDSRPECAAATMDYATVQRACACGSPLAQEDKTSRCSAIDAGEAARIARDVVVRVAGPVDVAAGAHADLDVRIQNTGDAPLKMLLVADAAPQLSLADAQGKAVVATYDAMCVPIGVLGIVKLARVTLPPGGVISTTVPFDAVKLRRVPRTPPPRSRTLSRREQIEALVAADCHDVPAGPLPPGDYTVDVRVPFWPQDLEPQLKAHAVVHVR
jgi:hypothetical protein